VKKTKKNTIINLTHNEVEEISTRAVEKALSKVISLLIEYKTALISEPLLELITPKDPVGYKK